MKYAYLLALTLVVAGAATTAQPQGQVPQAPDSDSHYQLGPDLFRARAITRCRSTRGTSSSGFNKPAEKKRGLE